jgi:hypothetical protein
MKCPRCEAVGRKPKVGEHEVIGPNGIKSLVCNKCIEEIKNIVELVEYEDEED